MDGTSVLLITAEDNGRSRLLTRFLLDLGFKVGVLSPIPFPSSRFPGVELIGARQLLAGELEPWFRQSPYSVVVDLGAFRPESIELLRRLHAGQIDHYIYCSSTAVYTPDLEPPVSETAPLGQEPEDLIAVELYLLSIMASDELPVTVLRQSPVYGEGDGVEAYLFDRLLFGRGILCPRSLEDVFQPLFVDDWMKAVVGIFRLPDAMGRCFNLVGQDWTTLGGFLATAAEAAYADLRLGSISPADLCHDLMARFDPFPLDEDGDEIYDNRRFSLIWGNREPTPMSKGLDLGFRRYLELAAEIGEPSIEEENSLVEELGIQVYPGVPGTGGPPKPAPESESAELPKAPTQRAGNLGAPTRLGFGSSGAQLRRPRLEADLPPPSIAPEILDSRLDRMADLMLAGTNRQGENEMLVEIKNEVLGGLKIKIRQKKRWVGAKFGCRRRSSKESLETSFPRLRRRLEQRGYFVSELTAEIIA